MPCVPHPSFAISETAAYRRLRTARAGAWVSPHWLWRVTHIYTPYRPSLFPLTMTHLDGRDRVVGSGGNLGVSRRGGTTELVNETRGGHPSSSSPSLTQLPCHSQSYGELLVEEDRARPECIAWHGLAWDPFRSLSRCSVCGLRRSVGRSWNATCRPSAALRVPSPS